MTKEELEKEAENFIIDRYKLNECYREDNAETSEYMRMDVHSQYEEEYQLYLAGAEPREKRIAELKAQIEKMKCCGNCQKLRGRFDSKTNINILYCSDSDMKQIEVGFQMCCCKWEIKEND